MISPQLYWVMTGDDFTLDLNNPEHPKILCVGNNPDRQNIYSAALGLYNSRIVKLVNKKGQLKSSIIIDELPTIYFRGIDNLIATARSNKVGGCVSAFRISHSLPVTTVTKKRRSSKIRSEIYSQGRWSGKRQKACQNVSAKYSSNDNPSLLTGRTHPLPLTHSWIR